MTITSSFRPAIAGMVLISSIALGQNVELTKLGTNAFLVDFPGSTTASFSQTATTLTFTGFDSGATANYLAGTFKAGKLNWTAYTNSPYITFALNMSSSGTNPNTSFSLDLIDSTFTSIATYGGTTTGLTGTLSLVNLTLDAVGSGAYNDVIALGFTWDGSMSSPNTITVESVYAVVPEPSTYALLALGGLALSGYAMRRRRRA